MMLEDLKGLKHMLKYELCKVSPRWSKLATAMHMQPWASNCAATLSFKTITSQTILNEGQSFCSP